MDVDWPGRWNHIKKLLERGGPFAHPDFEPSPEVILNLHILYIGFKMLIYYLKKKKLNK